MKIRIFSPWGALAQEYTHRFGQLGFVDDDSYTHAIILNNYIPEDLRTGPENTIGVALEPIEFLGLNEEAVRFIRKHVSKYFIGEHALALGPPFVNRRYFFTYMDYPLTLPEKDLVMSIAFSRKNHAPGHKYRHALVRAILGTDLPIHIYGHGCDGYGSDPRIKGPFADDLVVHGRYKYHIAIENYRREWYYTEKVINPLECGTVPLYWGCPNIGEVFPGVPIISLVGDLEHDMVTIRSLCEQQPEIPFDRSQIRGHISFQKVLDEWRK
jgi:hypothetical protein